jgi:hypothetical protein
MKMMDAKKKMQKKSKDMILEVPDYFTAEEIEKVRIQNYIAPTPVKVPVKPKKTKKKVVHDTDLDKVFSQFTKPAVKKKVLKAVVKKI